MHVRNIANTGSNDNQASAELCSCIISNNIGHVVTKGVKPSFLKTQHNEPETTFSSWVVTGKTGDAAAVDRATLACLSLKPVLEHAFLSACA